MDDLQTPGSFVLSMPRSGSTLLRLLLDTHSEIYAPDELLLGRLAFSLFSTLEGLCDEGDAANQHDFDHSVQALAETQRTLSRLMATHTRRHGKRMWCEKSPANLAYLRSLRRVFPDARCLLLHRHCLDNVRSCLEAGAFGFTTALINDYAARHPHDFVLAMVEAWVEQEERLIALEEESGEHCLRVRYEDLVVDPRRQLSTIFAFLEVADEAPEVIEKVFTASHHQRRTAGDGNALFSAGISQQRLGTGHEIPWRRIRSLPPDLFDRMNQLLERLGYPPVEDDDWDLGVATGGPPAIADVEASAAGDGADLELEDGGSLELGTLFERLLPARLAERDVSKLRGASYRFVLTGAGGGEWLVDLEDATAARVTAGGKGGACEIRLPVSALRDILQGTLNPAQAYRDGQVRLSGRIDVDALRALLALLAG